VDGSVGTEPDASVSTDIGAPTCREGTRELLRAFPAEDVGAAVDGHTVAIASARLDSSSVELEVVDSEGATVLAPTSLDGSPPVGPLGLSGIAVEASPLGYAVAWTHALELDDLVFGAAGSYQASQAVVVDRDGGTLVAFDRYGPPHDAYGHRVHSRRPQLLWMESDVLFAWQDLRTRTRGVGQVLQDSGIYGVTLDTVARSASTERLLAERASSREAFHMDASGATPWAAIVTSESRSVDNLSVSPLPVEALTALLADTSLRATDLAVGPDGTVYVAFVRGLYGEATVEVGTLSGSDLVTTTIGTPADWGLVDCVIAFHEGRPVVAWVDGLEVGWRYLDDAGSVSTTTIEGADAAELLDAAVTNGALRIAVARKLDDTVAVDLVETCL
jgi:hypothetical protein